MRAALKWGGKEVDFPFFKWINVTKKSSIELKFSPVILIGFTNFSFHLIINISGAIMFSKLEAALPFFFAKLIWLYACIYWNDILMKYYFSTKFLFSSTKKCCLFDKKNWEKALNRSSLS